MAHDHPIIAGAFVIGMISLIGNGAYKAIENQKAERAQAIVEAGKLKRERIDEGVRRGQAGDYEGAAAILALSVKQNPTDVDAAYNLGVALEALGRVDDAEKLFSEILAKNPGDHDTMAELGGLYDAKGDIERSFQLLTQVPAGEANMKARLEDPSRWTTARQDPRWAALALKHGVQAPPAEAPPPEELPEGDPQPPTE